MVLVKRVLVHSVYRGLNGEDEWNMLELVNIGLIGYGG
jgi:hypothetical protein